MISKKINFNFLPYFCINNAKLLILIKLSCEMSPCVLFNHNAQKLYSVLPPICNILL